MSTPALFENDRITGIHPREGKMRDRIDAVFVGSFDNTTLASLENQTRPRATSIGGTV
jgi:hypothetical protein